MRFVIFATIFISILACAGYVAYLAPYHIYTLALKEGIKTEFIETKVLPNEMLSGGTYKLGLIKQEDKTENDKLWPMFHFTHFKVPFPVHHPLYDIIPVINISEKRKVNLGLKISDRKDVVISSILVMDMKKLSLDLGKYKLFNLPIYKKMLLDTDLNKIWKDLFLKDITLPNYNELGFSKYVKAIQKYPYSELVYNLFLLKMRTEMFPDNAIKIGMLNDNNLGIVEVSHENNKYNKEYIYLREKNNIRILELITKKYTSSGKNYRNRVLKSISYQDSNENASVHLYSFFRELTYAQKIDQEGMIYLYSAWSHTIQKKEFLVQMIQWLERGKRNEKQLAPLFNYASTIYGTAFSIKDQLKEDAQKRLERKIKEELEDEIRDEKGNVYRINDGKFESEELQIKYFLQKAKDDNLNTDDDEDILVVE